MRLEAAIAVVLSCVVLVSCFELAERERPEEHTVRVRTFRGVVGSVLAGSVVLFGASELFVFARPLLAQATGTVNAAAPPALVLVGQLLQLLGLLR